MSLRRLLMCNTISILTADNLDGADVSLTLPQHPASPSHARAVGFFHSQMLQAQLIVMLVLVSFDVMVVSAEIDAVYLDVLREHQRSVLLAIRSRVQTLQAQLTVVNLASFFAQAVVGFWISAAHPDHPRHLTAMVCAVV